MKSTFWMTAQVAEDEIKRHEHILSRSFVVTRVDDQGDRILLTGDCDDYHVIAPIGCLVKVGDRITYEAYGANFGWLIEVKE